jgi:hypothetical protein
MPDGCRYDGRFVLDDDLRDWKVIKSEEMEDGRISETTEALNADVKDPEAMARWYDVTPEQYLASQAWAGKNLARVRREGKDRVEWFHNFVRTIYKSLIWPPADGTEPQPTPRRNGQRHKASMVAHRTRR